jgi:hypothetical protein
MTADLPLSMLQAQMSAALLSADAAAQQLPEALFAGALPGAEGLRVHRNTVLGALSHALRLTYPSVDRLVGEAFFDRMAVEFARAQPPIVPQLGAWGAGFAEFIADFPGTEKLPYLGELAQLDARFDVLARQVPDGLFSGVVLRLDAGVQLHLDSGLIVHVARFPVNALRAAILADDVAALAAIALTRRENHLALWRTSAGVMVRELSAPAAGYLRAALAGADGEQALAAAASAHAASANAASTGAVDAELATLLEREVLQASFLRIGPAIHQ